MNNCCHLKVVVQGYIVHSECVPVVLCDNPGVVEDVACTFCTIHTPSVPLVWYHLVLNYVLTLKVY